MPELTGTATGSPEAQQRHWLREIARAEKAAAKWRERARKIVRLYTRQGELATAERRFAMLWANTEVLKPAVLARTPQPAVARRFKDADAIGRQAAAVLERAIATSFERRQIDERLKSVRDDFLLVGRGTAWVRYTAEFAAAPQDPHPAAAPPPSPLQGEGIAIDYVHWDDFLHSPARTWSEVTWVARRAFLTREELRKRFGTEAGNAVGLDHKVERDEGSRDGAEASDVDRKATVYEIWSRTDSRVYFIARNHDKPLEVSEPFLTLDGFFPCPRPAYATLATDSLIPVPDYVYYQDQCEEIDALTQRIAALTDALKLVGFYPGGQGDATEAIEKALAPGVENKLIAVESWAAFTAGGGADKLIAWLPVETVVKVLQSSIELRRQLIDDVYQITGISDILRGETEASETAAAQTLKAQWGGIRIRDRQGELARFARDLTRIAGEIIAERFQPETLQQMTGIQPAPEVVELLRQDRLRGFRIDIETDSTIEPDEQAEKQRRNEFLTAVGGFLQQALPVAQAQPQMLPMLGEMLMFAVRGYRVGQQLEEVIERTIGEMQQAAQQAAQNPPPDPAMEKVKGEMALAEQRLAADLDAQLQKLALDAERQAAELQMEREKAAVDTELARSRAAFDQSFAVEGRAMERELSPSPPGPLSRKGRGGEGKAGPGVNPPAAGPGPVAAALVELAKQMQALGQMIAAGQAQTQAALTAPRQVVRDDLRGQ